MPTETERYYHERATEYDRVYDKPERASDIATLSTLITQSLRGRRVLELAAGTGYWTKDYADDAQTVMAIDLNEATLDVARNRRTWPEHTGFAVADAFDLAAIEGEFDAVFAGFLWSHITLETLDDFLEGVHRRLPSGSLVVFADNNYVEGSNHAIARADSMGNTYQRRSLSDGSSWEVLKNFPSRSDTAGRLDRIGHLQRFESLEFFWFASAVTV